MAMQVTSPTGDSFTVDDSNQVYDANNNLIGHVDGSSGTYIANDGGSVAVSDLAQQGWVFEDTFVASQGANVGHDGEDQALAVLPIVDGEPVGASGSNQEGAGGATGEAGGGSAAPVYFGVGDQGAVGTESVGGVAQTAEQELADAALVFVTQTVDETHWVGNDELARQEVVPVERTVPMTIVQAAETLGLSAEEIVAYETVNAAYLMPDGAVGSAEQYAEATGRPATAAERAYIVFPERTEFGVDNTTTIPAVYGTGQQHLDAVYDSGVYDFLPADIVDRAQASTQGHPLLASSDQVSTVAEHLDEQSLIFVTRTVTELDTSNDMPIAREVEKDFAVPVAQAMVELGLSGDVAETYIEARSAYVLLDGSVGDAAAFMRDQGRVPTDADRAFIVQPASSGETESGSWSTPEVYGNEERYLQAIGLPKDVARDATIAFNASWSGGGDAYQGETVRTFDSTTTMPMQAYAAVVDDSLAGGWVQIGDKGPLGEELEKILEGFYEQYGATTPEQQDVIKNALFRYDDRFGVIANAGIVASAVEMNEARRQGFFENGLGRAIVTAVAYYYTGPMGAAVTATGFALADGASLGKALLAGVASYYGSQIGANVGQWAVGLLPAGTDAVVSSAVRNAFANASSSAFNQVLLTGNLDADTLLKAFVSGGVSGGSAELLGSSGYLAQLNDSLGLRAGTLERLVGDQVGRVATGDDPSLESLITSLGAALHRPGTTNTSDTRVALFNADGTPVLTGGGGDLRALVGADGELITGATGTASVPGLDGLLAQAESSLFRVSVQLAGEDSLSGQVSLRRVSGPDGDEAVALLPMHLFRGGTGQLLTTSDGASLELTADNVTVTIDGPNGPVTLSLDSLRAGMIVGADGQLTVDANGTDYVAIPLNAASLTAAGTSLDALAGIANRPLATGETVVQVVTDPDGTRRMVEGVVMRAPGGNAIILSPDGAALDEGSSGADVYVLRDGKYEFAGQRMGTVLTPDGQAGLSSVTQFVADGNLGFLTIGDAALTDLRDQLGGDGVLLEEGAWDLLKGKLVVAAGALSGALSSAKASLDAAGARTAAEIADRDRTAAALFSLLESGKNADGSNMTMLQRLDTLGQLMATTAVPDVVIAVKNNPVLNFLFKEVILPLNDSYRLANGVDPNTGAQLSAVDRGVSAVMVAFGALSTIPKGLARFGEAVVKSAFEIQGAFRVGSEVAPLADDAAAATLRAASGGSPLYLSVAEQANELARLTARGESVATGTTTATTTVATDVGRAAIDASSLSPIGREAMEIGGEAFGISEADFLRAVGSGKAPEQVLIDALARNGASEDVLAALRHADAATVNNVALEMGLPEQLARLSNETDPVLRQAKLDAFNAHVSGGGTGSITDTLADLDTIFRYPPIANTGVNLNRGTGGTSDIWVANDGTVVKTPMGLGNVKDMTDYNAQKALEAFGGPKVGDFVRIEVDGQWKIGFTLERVDGIDLLSAERALASNGALPFPVTEQHLKAVSDFFEQVRATGRYLGDVQPGDFMLTPDGRIVPLDMMLGTGAGASMAADEAAMLDRVRALMPKTMTLVENVPPPVGTVFEGSFSVAIMGPTGVTKTLLPEAFAAGTDLSTVAAEQVLAHALLREGGFAEVVTARLGTQAGTLVTPYAQGTLFSQLPVELQTEAWALANARAQAYQAHLDSVAPGRFVVDNNAENFTYVMNNGRLEIRANFDPVGPGNQSVLESRTPAGDLPPLDFPGS